MKSADVHLRWNRSFAFFRLLPLLPLLFFSTNISRVCFCLPEDDQISLVIDISWHRADFLLLTHGYNDVVAAASLSLLFFRIRPPKKKVLTSTGNLIQANQQIRLYRYFCPADPKVASASACQTVAVRTGKMEIRFISSSHPSA